MTANECMYVILECIIIRFISSGLLFRLCTLLIVKRHKCTGLLIENTNYTFIFYFYRSVTFPPKVGRNCQAVIKVFLGAQKGSSSCPSRNWKQ